MRAEPQRLLPKIFGAKLGKTGSVDAREKSVKRVAIKPRQETGQSARREEIECKERRQEQCEAVCMSYSCQLTVAVWVE